MTALAAFVFLTLLAGALKRIPVYAMFIEGAREGLRTALHVLPPLAAMMVAMSVMNAGGLTDALHALIAPVFEWIGVPRETLPVMLMRPLSGSGALAALRGVLSEHGADSRVGLIACVMVGSSETVLYTCSVYLGAAGVRRSRHIVPAALLSWLAGCVAACLLF